MGCLVVALFTAKDAVECCVAVVVEVAVAIAVDLDKVFVVVVLRAA